MFQPGGNYLAASGAQGSAGGSTAFTLARLDSSGRLHPGLRLGGTRTLKLPGGGQASVVLIQPEGKILVIGQGFIRGGGVALIRGRHLAQ